MISGRRELSAIKVIGINTYDPAGYYDVPHCNIAVDKEYALFQLGVTLAQVIAYKAGFSEEVFWNIQIEAMKLIQLKFSRVFMYSWMGYQTF